MLASSRCLWISLLAGASAFGASSTVPVPPAKYEGYFDLSDSATQAYIFAQLTAVGISQSGYPSLYSSISASQSIYAKANAQGIVIPVGFMTYEGNELEPINLVAPSYSQPSSTISATETSSIPYSPYAVANTLGLFANSVQIGVSTGAVSIGTGNEVTCSLTEPVQPGVTQYQAQGISVFVYSAGTFGDYAASVGIPATASVALALPLSGVFSSSGTTTITNTAPTTIQHPSYMKLCIGRKDADCDYAYPLGNVQMPLGGSVSFPSPIAVNPTTGVPTLADYNVAIWYPDVGGGCQMPDADFAKQVTISNNVLSWNADPAQFGTICTLYTYGSEVTVTYQLSMQVQSIDGTMMPATITTDSTYPAGDATLKLVPLEFVYGCLAAGTLITMDPKGKGKEKTKRIEKVKADEMVLGPGGAGLKVSSFAKGPEEEHLYRVSTAGGHSVDMTSMHAVPLPGGRVKLAKELSPGDSVTTDKGPAKITGISRVAAKGMVWNLALGVPQSSRAPIDMSVHSFYANGILVGDGRAQNYFSRKHKEHPSQVLARLPKAWHHDFYNAQLYTPPKSKTRPQIRKPVRGGK